MPNYFAIKDFSAKKNLSKGGYAVRKFKKGQIIAAKEVNKNGIPCVETFDGFAFPKTVVDSISYSAADGESMVSINDKIKKTATTDFMGETYDKSKRSIRGVIGGGIIGAGFALYRNGNVMLWAFIGGVVGGVVGNKLEI